MWHCFYIKVLECVNGDYGDYNDILREESKKPEWHYKNNNSIRPLEANNEVQVIKMSENSDASVTFTASKHIYPPPEWMRLWMLVGRCHVQILRDWVSNSINRSFISNINKK